MNEKWNGNHSCRDYPKNQQLIKLKTMTRNFIKFTSLAIAIMVCVTNISCSNDEAAPVPTPAKNDGVEELNANLRALNATYSHANTRVPKWLRWLIVGAADVGGYLLGNVSAAASLSTVAWTVTGDDKNKDDESLIVGAEAIPLYANTTTAIKWGQQNTPVPGIGMNFGEVHNNIIKNAIMADSTLLTKDPNTIVNQVLDAASAQTGNNYSEAERFIIIDLAEKMMDCYNSDMSITQYMNNLKALTADQNKKDALDACAIVLEGMQYVDDNDTGYVAKVTNIVKASTIKPELKTVILNGVSVADGSAKLWNSDILLNN